jgi:uncharacterized membrane protein
VAAAGLGLAGYLTATRLAGGSALFCASGGGCEVVQASRYGEFLGLPTAAWGAALYAAVGAVALAGLTPARWLLAFLLASAAVAFSAYLTYLELFVIGALCGYCVVSAGLAAVLFGLLLGRRAAVGRWRWLRPARVATLAAVVGVATVALGFAGHYAGPGGGGDEYRAALARHLARSGAVMYGAFW